MAIKVIEQYLVDSSDDQLILYAVWSIYYTSLLLKNWNLNPFLSKTLRMPLTPCRQLQNVPTTRVFARCRGWSHNLYEIKLNCPLKIVLTFIINHDFLKYLEKFAMCKRHWNAVMSKLRAFSEGTCRIILTVTQTSWTRWKTYYLFRISGKQYSNLSLSSFDDQFIWLIVLVSNILIVLYWYSMVSESVFNLSSHFYLKIHLSVASWVLLCWQRVIVCRANYKL